LELANYDEMISDRPYRKALPFEIALYNQASDFAWEEKIMTSVGTILVVDDMPETVELLKDILEKEGYRVYCSENGKLAKESIETHHPDLVLLDIHMPVMNGFELFKWMRTREESRDITVIFLSAHMESDVRIIGLKMGAVDYITKPCDREELLTRIQIHMELRHARSLLQSQNETLRLTNVQLKLALDNIKVLRGLIPICANCKKIRGDEGYWEAVDKYLSEHSEVRFSHGICPDCMKSLYPKFTENESAGS